MTKVADFRPATKNANKHSARGMGALQKSVQTDGWIGAMPRANAVCNVPGCPTIAVQAGRCAVHQRETARKYDGQRGTPAQRGYDRDWQKIRKAYIAKHPYCAQCGRYAVIVDHILPLRRGGTHDASNLQSMCRACHSGKTVTQDGGYGNAARAQG